ncbi:MAG: type II secretion system protein M [Gammaproteobacteria bacterium]|nr:type II secretion system protein M [Gammaproteobacteria bacterium]MCF6229643.1 type II secretion system protein M [Gammaproteobacteria bacterium]
MKAWFEELNSRERSTLLLGGGALLLMLLYSLLWSPLSAESERLQRDIESQHATLAWMQQAAQQVKTSSMVNNTRRGAEGESLLTLVDRSAKKAVLGGNIKRVQPDKDGSVRIWLEKVEFNSMMRWLATLSREYGVVLGNSNIEKQSTAGLVDARLTLKRSRS